MYVFPVLAVKQVREDEEDRHKDQDENPQTLTLYFYRVTHVGQEVGQVPHGAIEFRARHTAFDGILGARILVVDVATERLNRGIHADTRPDCTQTLQLYHYVRHAHQVEDRVVDTQRTGVVLVEATQVGIHPGLPTHTADQSQIRRRSTKPAGRHVLVHGVLHQLTNLGIGENQVFLEQLCRDFQVFRNALVAGVFHGVTTHAVVGEQRSTTLQGCSVGVVRIHGVERHRATCRQPYSRQQYKNETKNKLSHYPVTLSGTGLVFSQRV